MSRQVHTYDFDGLGLSPIATGTNLLVTGPALGGIRELLVWMLVCRTPEEGALFIAADAGGPETLEAYDRLSGGVNPARVGVVDCTQEDSDDGSRNVHSVGGPGDLTGVGIEFSSLYQELVEKGARFVRTGIYTLSPFVMYADSRAVFRFLHTLTGRIRTADGLGVCAVDPETLDDRTLSSLAQAFDGRVRLRRDEDGPRISVDGIPDQHDEWQSVDL